MAMAMATNQLQGSCSTFFAYVPSSWNSWSKVKHFLPSFHPVGRKDRLISLKCRSQSSVGASLDQGPKSRNLKVDSFKGSNWHDDSGSRENGWKSINVKISFLEHESEESALSSSNAQDVPDEPLSRSLAIQNLFKKWLMLLRTPPQTEPAEETMEEPSSLEPSELPNTVHKQENGQVLKAAWSYFLSLDATIKIPLLIFTPFYVAVSVAYGPEASNELTPLWILGPLVVALYVKMFQAICRLYAFSFKQTVKVVKNLPGYGSLVHEYVIRGKLKEVVQANIWQPLADMKNMDLNRVAIAKLKDLRGWLTERYLDFIESIWPYYCRIIRFLKRANLI